MPQSRGSCGGSGGGCCLDCVACAWFVIVMVIFIYGECSNLLLDNTTHGKMSMNSWNYWYIALGLLIVVVVHNKKGKTYSFPLAGLAITLLAYSLIG